METRSWFRRRGRAPLLAALSAGLLLWAPPARAQEPEKEPEEESSSIPLPQEDPGPPRVDPRNAITKFFVRTPEPPVTRGPRAVLTRVAVRQAYGNAALTQDGVAVATPYTSIEPHFRFVHKGPRDFWLLGYRLEGRIFPEFSDSSTLGHDANLSWTSRLSRKWTLGTEARYLSSPGGVLETTPAGGIAGLLGPSSSSADFLARKVISREFRLSLDADLSATRRFAVGGFVADRSYSGLPLPGDRRSEAFVVFSERVATNHSLGPAYQMVRLDFDDGFGHSVVHNILAFYSYHHNRNLTVTFFAGPSIVALAPGDATGMPRDTRARWTAGAELEKALARSFLRLRAARVISAGEGFLSTTERSEGLIGVRREFTRRWEGSLDAIYAHNRALESGDRFQSASLEPSVRYRFSPAASLVTGARGVRLWNVALSPRFLYTAYVTFEYKFQEPF